MVVLHHFTSKLEVLYYGFLLSIDSESNFFIFSFFHFVLRSNSSANLSLRPPQSPRDAGLRFQQPITPPSSSNPHTPASPHTIASNHPSFSMTSPPGSHIPHPSPSTLMPSSPLNPQPSPMPAHSPGPNLAFMQSQSQSQSHPPDSSPFAAMSPAAANWPGSPMRPSPGMRRIFKRNYENFKFMNNQK